MTANIVYTVLFAIILAPATAVLRWQFGKSHWAAYPGGSTGHLRDCITVSLALIPICAGCVFYSLELGSSQTRQIVAISLFAVGMVYSFVPVARRANLRLIQARYDGVKS